MLSFSENESFGILFLASSSFSHSFDKLSNSFLYVSIKVISFCNSSISLSIATFLYTYVSAILVSVEYISFIIFLIILRFFIIVSFITPANSLYFLILSLCAFIEYSKRFFCSCKCLMFSSMLITLKLLTWGNKQSFIF